MPKTPGFDKLLDKFRRILQISVNNDHGIATRMIQSGGKSDLFSKVSAQVYDTDSQVLRVKLIQNVECLVLTPIIDIDDLGKEIEPKQRGGQTRVEVSEPVLFVVCGNNYRKNLHSLGIPPSSAEGPGCIQQKVESQK
jgi:hypothetical protein